MKSVIAFSFLDYVLFFFCLLKIWYPGKNRPTPTVRNDATIVLVVLSLIAGFAFVLQWLGMKDGAGGSSLARLLAAYGGVVAGYLTFRVFAGISGTRSAAIPPTASGQRIMEIVRPGESRTGDFVIPTIGVLILIFGARLLTNSETGTDPPYWAFVAMAGGAGLAVWWLLRSMLDSRRRFDQVYREFPELAGKKSLAPGNEAKEE